jgi:hypothetical protein
MAKRTTSEVWAEVDKDKESGMRLPEISKKYNLKYVTVHAHFAKMKSKEPIS